MRAAAYLRVSTDGQVGEDKYGLAAQRQAVSEYAEANGIEIVQWYSDEGFSGAVLDRPALQSLLSDATHFHFYTVLVARTDRIARDLFIQLWVEKELSKHNVQIFSVGEPFHGSDPMTVAFRQMAGVFAELEKHRIRERMSAGRKQKARGGGYAGGGAPLGYYTERGGRALRLDEEKVETVRRIFELHHEHPEWKLDYVAAALNSEGHTTANGKAFTRVQVWRVLKREEFYKGKYFYSGVSAQGKHTPILGGLEKDAAMTR
jgi:DNA invertase Pin-like site-specific DNA recombinase